MTSDAAPTPMLLALSQIIANAAMQPRVSMNAEHRERLARFYLDGGVEPRVDVFRVCDKYYLVDGFHRFFAKNDIGNLRHDPSYIHIDFDHIRCNVHVGTMREGLAFAAQANLCHTALPMTIPDREKAMHMLLEDKDWATKAPSAISKHVGLSHSKGRGCWLAFFEKKGVNPPSEVLDTSGRVIPTTTRRRDPSLPPKITSKPDGQFAASVGGKTIPLGGDPEKAKKRLQDVIDSGESKKTFYESSHCIASKLIFAGISSVAVVDCTMNPVYPGIFGRVSLGVTFTWESFREKPGAISAWGRADACRALTKSSRVVVLCPVGDAPTEVLKLAIAHGIEWMTIEDFIASLKGEGESTPEAS